jgi:hypothetical protein
MSGLHAYVSVPKSFMKFIFSTVYRVTKKFLCTSVHFSVGTCCSSTDTTEVVELLTPNMVKNTWQELECRLDICRATTGANI